jgi:hypothetical protein
MLRDCEFEIRDTAESQWRQVHPQFVDGDFVSSEAFVGVPGERDEVSTVRSALRSAAEAYEHYVGTLGLASAGCWATSVAEITEAGSRAVADHDCDHVETPGHSYIDMRGMTKAQKRITRAALAAAATGRGRQHPERA